MSLRAHLDFETGSDTDLRHAGVHRYADCPTTRVFVLCWRLGNAATKAWHPGQPFPDALAAHVESEGVVVAHNAAFERIIWNKVLSRIVPGLPPMRIEQTDCTMSRCSALAIPPSLGDAAKVLRLDERKDAQGHRLMIQMSKPRRKPCIICDGDGCGFCEYRGFTFRWFDEPEKIEKLTAYCMQDVATEFEVDHTVPALSPRERETWELDQRINERGFLLDIPLIAKASAIVDHAQALLNRRLAEVSNGALLTCSAPTQISAYLTEQGLRCDSLAKDHHAWLIAEAKSMGRPDLAEIVQLRRLASKSSTKKLDAALACTSADGRARDQYFFHGAAPGRWAGRLIQPQNLYRVDAERDGDDIETAISIMLAPGEPAKAHDLLGMLVDAPMVVIPKCIRQTIIAPPGKVLIGGDQSNIESRLAAWFADENWKLDAFRAYDAGLGPDLYKIGYSQSFGVPVDQVTGPQRQIGKVGDLACSYQGAVSAYVSMSKNYFMNIADMVPVVRAASGEEKWALWLDRFERATSTADLPRDQWAAVSIVVRAWREANARIVQCWWALQDAAVEAMSEPGNIAMTLNGRCAYLCARNFLWLSLPSGRCVAYAHPELRTTKEDIYEDANGNKVQGSDYFPQELDRMVKNGELSFAYTRTRRTVWFEGFESERHVWTLQPLYGGMQFNHVVQGTARDVIRENMLAAEAEGYPVVLHTHDELVAEVDEGFGSADELRSIMTRPLPWLPLAPLAAKTWRGHRYEK